ncbi:hypothetical protein ACF8D3_13495 [Acinetobacter sp. YQ_14]|uniref:hypothetical protein n=1 Tax=Acinetobacter sp. YQ_14 TaxID=3367236 RepID=UPI00370A1485
MKSLKLILVAQLILILFGCASLKPHTLTAGKTGVNSSLNGKSGGQILEEKYKGKIITRDFVYKTGDIDNFPAAIILLTDKWYTKEPASKLCERIIMLPPSKDKSKEFVTYWLVDKKKLDSEESDCNYLKLMYNYSEAKAEIDRIFKDRFINKNLIQRIYGNITLRGPYIAIYEDKSRETDLIIDLNKLGPKSTEYFIENWSNILKTVEMRGSVKNPAASILAAIANDPKLKKLEREDLTDNLVLWSKAGVCVGLVAASISTTVTVGTNLNMNDLTTIYVNTENGLKKNQSYCGAISEIAKK